MKSQIGSIVAMGALAAASGCPGAAQPQEERPAEDEPAEAEDPGAEAVAPHVAEFEEACREHFERGKELREEIAPEADGAGVESILEPYNEMSMHLRNASGLASVMRNVHPDEDIRDAASACEREVSAFQTELSLDPELYEAFSAIDADELDEDAARLVEHTLRDLRRSGADRDADTRERVRELDERLVELGQEFSENIAADVRSIEVESEEDLAGLPDDFIESRAPEDEDEPFTITTQYPDYNPFMNYAESTELRRELFVENRSRGGVENEELLEEMLALRAERADLLGYDDWADYATEVLMIESGDNAAAFIDDVSDMAEPRVERDLERLLERKREDEPEAEVIQEYESSYYENLVQREDYDFDAQAARAYFPYERVEEGLLEATETLFEIEYEPVEDASVWHESVSVYDVVQDGRELGRVYLDMHPREGKFSHAAQFTKQPGVAGQQRPEGVLVCNFPDPSGGDALMEHGDVTTMFHEFGHLMHNILGGQNRWVDQSGVATEWDFVEAPAQMFEEWAWQHESLERFAHHVDTDEPIGEDLAERMREADEFGKGIWAAQQMFYASLSLGFHRADPDELDMMGTLRELQDAYSPYPYVDGTRFYSAFGHLDGYSSNYYTYMWSLVLAKDMFTPFEENGIWHEETAHRFRDEVLAPGGTRDAADLVASFLGREFSFEAFEDYLRD